MSNDATPAPDAQHPTSSETLRRAAALMRERAEAVVTWATDHPEESGGPDAWFTPMFIANAFAAHAPGDTHDPELREGWTLDGDHYASWHPTVALAVADWLEGVASRYNTRYPANAARAGWNDALDVARAYLGEA